MLSLGNFGDEPTNTTSRPGLGDGTVALLDPHHAEIARLRGGQRPVTV